MELTSWELISVVFKLLIYISSSIAIGAGFIRKLAYNQEALRHSIDRYYAMTVFVGLFSSLSFFLLQVGAFAEEGIIGMFNGEFANMLWQSSLGDALDYQVLGFLLLWFGKSGAQLIEDIDPKIQTKYFSISTMIFGALILARSFSVVGHSVEYALIFQLILSLHFLCVAWWIGSLVPLKTACRVLERNALFQLMDTFGKFASVVVAVLIVSGTTLLVLFSDGKLAFFTTDYGLLLLAKLALVSAILVIALHHKLKLVPSLAKEVNANIVLERSIFREALVAIFILITTAILTIVVGTSN